MNPIRHLSTVGLLLGTLLFAFSLTPSLLPRHHLVQGVVSGLALAAGYALGAAACWLWSYLQIPAPRPRAKRIARLTAAAVCFAVAAAFLWRASEWQNSVRTLMDMDPVSGARPFTVALIALLVFGSLLALTWLFRRTFAFLSRKLHPFVPPRVSKLIGVAAALILFWSIINGVIFRLALRAADTSYQQLDAIVPHDLRRPDDPAKTGSPESFISWDDLGREGRAFISARPTAQDLRDFHGNESLEPIRVYVGLNAADTPEARARLALRELKRVGAFDRSILLLVTPTGTGWIDPAAQSPVEYLYRGDIATVAAQYSYLPSHLALIVEGDYGAETARALFEQVYGHWTRLPPDNRPALYLHGLSLGALNSERSFHLHDILADPFQGALWSGPPFRSTAWNDITANREPDSPPWLPRFRDGSIVRFMNQHGGLHIPDTPWGPLRIAYLQYASDPVTFFGVRSLYTEPAWMRQPRGPDVSPHLRWYPIVTFLQLAADMAVGAAPPGYGHTYAADHYIDAWLALTEPTGWSEQDIQRLRSLHQHHAPRK